MAKATATAAAADDNATAKPTDEVASGSVKYSSPSGQGNRVNHAGQTSSNQDQQSGLVMQPGVTPNPATLMPLMGKRSSTQNVPSQTHAAYHVMNGNILMPTPIAASSESVLQGTNKMMNNFDLKDFENEQDPFENLSLKVINDIEELDKVFLATSRSQTNIGTSPPTEAAGISQQRGQQHTQQQQQQEFPSDCVVHMNASAAFPQDGTNTSQHLQEKVNASNPMIASTQGASVFYPSLPCSTALVSSGNTSNAWLPSAHLPVSQNYEARIPDSILTGNLMSSVLPPKHKALTSEIHDKSELSFTVQTPISVTSSSSKQIAFTNNGVLYGRPPPGSVWPLEASGSPWPPVNPLGYCGPSQNSIHGQLEYDHSHMSCPLNLPMRSAKSNPDLSVVDTSVGGSSGWYGRHTPPIDTRSHSKPDRTNVNQVGQDFHRMSTNQISK